MRNFCQAMLENHLPQARTIFNKLFPLHQALFLEANPIPVKWALAHMQKSTLTFVCHLLPFLNVITVS